MPEAGGDFAEYFELGSIQDAYEKIKHLIGDAAYRASRETAIAKRFRAREWAAVAQDILGGVEALRGNDNLSIVSGLAKLKPGAIHAMVSQSNLPAADGPLSAEGARTCEGWHPCEDWGAWMSQSQARLTLCPPADPLRECLLYLGVRGNPGGAMKLTISAPN